MGDDVIMFGCTVCESDFSFSEDHQRVGRTSDTCQNSTTCVDAC